VKQLLNLAKVILNKVVQCDYLWSWDVAATAEQYKDGCPTW